MRHISHALFLGVTFCAAYLLSGSPSGAQPKSTPKLSTLDAQTKTDDAIDEYYKKNQSERAYLMVDKPLYQPGETIWFRVDLRSTQKLAPSPKTETTIELLSPKGAVIGSKRIKIEQGVGENDFVLPSDATGGQYQLRLKGGSYQKPIIVASYEAPRIKKNLQFLRKAYGPGAQVNAAVQLDRQTGEPLALQKITAIVTVEDKEIHRAEYTTDESGGASLAFSLPKSINKADGLLTLVVSEGGNTESIQRRIPILLQRLEVSMYPEGGDIVAGLNNRVYFSARDSFGKPADISGRLVDDTGKEITKLSSLHDGLGRFSFLSSEGRSYFIELEKPANTERIALPKAKKGGCNLQSVDDFESKKESLELLVSCTSPQKVFIEAVLREQRLASASFQVDRELSILGLKLPKETNGAVRVTLFNEKQEPLEERLIYRQSGGLSIAIKPDKKSYGPREKVTLSIEASIDGAPIEANLGLSVVDDTVLSFADDKSASLLSQMLLLHELDGQSIHDPDFYFSREPSASEALDLLLGTRGYRRFDWQLILANKVAAPSKENKKNKDEVNIPLKERPAQNGTDKDADGILDSVDKCPEVPSPDDDGCPKSNKVSITNSEIRVLEMIYFDNNSAKIREPGKPILDAVAEVMKDYPELKKVQIQGHCSFKEKDAMKLSQKRAETVIAYLVSKGVEAKRLEPLALGTTTPMVQEKTEDDRARNRFVGFFILEHDAIDYGRPSFAAVRVFPKKEYKENEAVGVRDDLRETIFWQAQVKTNKEGKASVSFSTSDAITSFRVTAEGFSVSGVAGHAETLFTSTKPFRVEAALPQEVSAGDVLSVPVTLTNETDKPLSVSLSASFGAMLKLQNTPSKTVSLSSREAKTIFYELSVVGQRGVAEINISAEAKGMKDAIKRALKVVPPGFPVEASLAGSLKDSISHEINLSDAITDTTSVEIVLYPSPLASLEESVEGLIREPYGCFEQTSASNYPNVLAMKYLQESGKVNAATLKKTNELLERGYERLIGYEVNKKGFEWFGKEPAHEALTAYGVMQFTEMKEVYPQVDAQMIKRAVKWIVERRDGKGGYLRSDKGLDSFGRASLETTNAYITWAMTEAGYSKEFSKEILALQTDAESTKDTYRIALAANALLNENPKSKTGAALLQKLAGLQAKNGSFAGGAESITRSGEASLLIETTSLAVLAMLKAPEQKPFEAGLPKAIHFINQNRSGFGTWGNTQATILGLRASLAYSKFEKSKTSPGEISITLDGKEWGALSYTPNTTGALSFSIPAEVLSSKAHSMKLTHKGEKAIPYSVAIMYRTRTPSSKTIAPVSLKTTLSSKEAKWSESVKLTAIIENATAGGVPMTLARIQLPGGLVPQTWQLQELVDKKLVDLYETREQEVILYWRALAPNEKKTIELSLLAKTPGRFTSQASSVYLYYTSEEKAWIEPITVTIKQ